MDVTTIDTVESLDDLQRPLEGRKKPSAKLASKLAQEGRRMIRAGIEPADRKILLIGGAGYIGVPVTTELLRRGFAVRNLDNLVYGHQAAMRGALSHPSYEFIYGDMGNPDDLARALDGVSDVVILAGLVGDPITKKFPEAAAEINDRAMRTCIDALNGHSLNKVIFVSTCSNYGLRDQNDPADETAELKPLSLYAKSKVAAEQHLLSLKGKVDYHPTILRFATAFGLASRMRFDLTVNEFTRDLFLDKELLVFDAHTWRPYCHVKDFARLIHRVLLFPVADVSFEVFNAGSDANNHTKQHIVDLVCERLPERTVRYRDNSADPRNYRVSFEKVRTRLMFECRHSVADGIDELIWALGSHLFDDADAQRHLFGNYELAARTPASAQTRT